MKNENIQNTDEFFNVKLSSKKTTQGDVKLPVLYFDTSNLLVFFIAKRDKVEEMLEGTGLEPGLCIANYAVVVMSFYEYRKTSVGVYNEVGVAIPVLPVGTSAPLSGITDMFREISNRDLGFWVVDLPVTTELANAAGREIWGYPKFVTDIVFSKSGRRFHGKVLAPGERDIICSLDGNLGFGVKMSPISPLTYTKHKGKMLRTEVNVRGDVSASIPLSMKLTVGQNQHPMTQRLLDLGLDGARPISAMYTDEFQSRLNKGSVVNAVSTV